jgi:hypothetical protein
MSVETIKFKVILNFPWSMHNKGDIIEVYKGGCMSYVVQNPDDGYGYPGASDKVDLRDFPEIYELVKE